MKKWYMQIAVGLVALIVITILSEAIYPQEFFPTKEKILSSGDPRAFYFLAILALVAQVLLAVGLVRGLLALIRKFRGFVRIDK
jgi:hypothetical protein